MPYAIGIDVGTTNLKVALVRDDATPVGAAQRPLPIERGPGTAGSTNRIGRIACGAIRSSTSRSVSASRTSRSAPCSR